MADTPRVLNAVSQHGTRILGSSTLIPLGLLGGVLMVLVGAIFWAATLRSDVNYLREEVRGLRSEIREVLNDHEARLRAVERSRP